MNLRRINLFNILKIIVLSILFYIAIIFENTHGNRQKILIIVFVFYIAIGIIRNILIKNKELYSYSYLIDIFLIYLFEHKSRFLINYFFHSFYIVILLEVSLTLKRDKGLIIGIITVGVSLIKYVMLIYYKTNLANISEMAFFILVNALILIVASFAQYNREEKEKKELLYNELLSTHRKLKQYAQKVERLSKIEERNRIARDIHDTLGHNMTALIMQMEMASHMIDKDIDKAKELLEKAKKTAREGLINIREVVEALYCEESNSKGIESIRELIEEFSDKTRVEVILNVKGDSIKSTTALDINLYKIIQESLTNAARHGEASKITVNLEYTEKGVRFKISDNGKGAKKYKEGFGIKGMKERVEGLRGNIKFQSKNGFIVKGFLPMEVKK